MVTLHLISLRIATEWMRNGRSDFNEIDYMSSHLTTENDKHLYRNYEQLFFIL